MSPNQEIEYVLQYHFQDHKLLDEALVAAGAGTSAKQSGKHGKKALALIGDAILRLVLVDDGVLEDKSTGTLLETATQLA